MKLSDRLLIDHNETSIIEQIRSDNFFGTTKTHEEIKQSFVFDYIHKRLNDPQHLRPDSFDIENELRDAQVIKLEESTRERMSKLLEINQKLPPEDNTNTETSKDVADILFGKFSISQRQKILKILSENKHLDARITLAINSSLWNFRRMTFNDNEVENLVNLIMELESHPKIRLKERRYQKNRYQPDKKELVFNHFLDVQETSLKFIDRIIMNWSELTKSEQQKFRPILDKDSILVITMSALFHDILEDKYLNEKEIRELLNKWSINNKSIQNRIISNIKDLNVENFKDTDEKIDYKRYVKKLEENPETFLVKIADIFSNFRSGGISLSEDRLKNKDSQEHKDDNKDALKKRQEKKYQQYLLLLDEIAEASFAKFIPSRFLDEIEKNNQHVPTFIRHAVWEKLRKKSTDFELTQQVA